MKLYADSREPRGLLELLNSRLSNIETGNLDIGDFIIKNNNDEIKMIFERKTIADLISSIKDGRYKEQSYRLAQLPLSNHNIFYVIEGNLLDFTLKNNETLRKTLYSAMFSLSYKKGFSLLHANGWLDTAEYIIRFMDKLGEDSSNTVAIPASETTDDVKDTLSLKKYTSSIKCTKKSNITRYNIGEIMLAQIPGVSMTVAQYLMEKYKTIKNLIDLLEKDENSLDDFKIESKNGFRKINKTTILSLKKFLIQI